MNPEQWLSLKWNGGSTMSDRWLNQSKIIQTDVENAGTVTFWAANKDEKQISSDYDQKLNSKVNINFNKNGYNRKNKQIKLGMENKKWTFNQRGFVSGEVDFR